MPASVDRPCPAAADGPALRCTDPPARPDTADPRRRLIVAVPLLAAALALSACTGRAQVTDAVSLETARAEHEAGRALLIDIREPEEHARGVARGARLLPMSRLASRLSEIPGASSQPVLLICNTQNRSRATLEALRERGYANVRYVEGGMAEWVRRGWPVVPPAR